MNTLDIKKGSLHGRATFIRNLLRGGIATDDDSFPLSMLREAVVTQSTLVVNQDHQARYAAGMGFDPDLVIKDQLQFEREKLLIDEPVVFLTAIRPLTVQWWGDAAIRYIKARHAPDAWAVATSERDAIIKAKAQAYHPAKPAYFFDGPYLRAAVPVETYGLIREVDISYIPARLDRYADGTERDIYEEDFPLPDRLWESVWQTVYKNLGGSLIQTSPNRDEVNNGADVTVQPN